MPWNVEQITAVALGSANTDYAAFEAIGLAEMHAARALDVGCLDGFNTHLKFAPYDNLELIVGIDPFGDGIDHARATVTDQRFYWETCGLQDYRTQGESFDVVYLSHVFRHLPDKPAMLKRIGELLKPGGFVVIKTVDDSMKTSSPDPDCLMAQVLALYDEQVRPFAPHTANTDRYNGAKCYSMLKQAGFADARIGVFHTDTAGMTPAEREALFERMTYFRRNVPASRRSDVQAKMNDLLERWHALFANDEYYFDTTTIMALARKPLEGGLDEPFFYQGPAFGKPLPVKQADTRGSWAISPMTEEDLGEVMEIELASFPDPWTPLAYATEIRHNPLSHYVTAKNDKGALCGYIGWWDAPDASTIAHIAVKPHMRKSGVGRILIEYACEAAAVAGKLAMLLQVRGKNIGAQAFYEKLGFAQVDISRSYYANPDDDAVIMTRPLSTREKKADEGIPPKARIS